MPCVTHHNAPLAPHTTLRVGGPALQLHEVQGAEDLRRLVVEADRAGRPLFVLGGGSNVLIGDEGFAGDVVHTSGGRVEESDMPLCPGKTVIRVEAGTDWDDVVSWAVEHGLAGIEALSGVPGQIGSAVMQNLGAYGQEVGGALVGATLLDRADASIRYWEASELGLGYRTIGSAVMQNLGAYGQEVGGALVGATLLDRADASIRYWEASELGLGYRTSMLRSSMERDGSSWSPSPRWIVLEAFFALTPSECGRVDHPQLARALECEPGVCMPLRAIRESVLAVRSHKGMVRDGEPDGPSPSYDRWSSGSFLCEPGVCMPLRAIRESVLAVRSHKGMVRDGEPDGPSPSYDRWSSGSFFTNPVLSADMAGRVLPADAPRYPTGDPQTVKTSAAWLIEHAGFPKGFGVAGASSRATLSTLHTLALTNRGEATASDVVELAQVVRDGVRERFGIELEPESVLVGVTLH